MLLEFCLEKVLCVSKHGLRERGKVEGDIQSEGK